MVCPYCGAELADGARFCVGCGAALDGTQDMPVANPAVAPAPVGSPAHSKKPKKGVVIAIVCAAVIVVSGGGGLAYHLYQQHVQEQEQYESAHSKHALVVNVKAEGWDTDNGASRVPVCVKGKTVDGKKVDKVEYVASDGSGIKLIQGKYTLKAAGSPIAAEVTDDEINDAVTLAMAYKGKNAPNVDALQHAATNRRDTAVAAKKAAEEEAARQAEEQRKAAARHIEAQTFSVDLPEYWDGRVTAEVDGDVIGLYSTAFPDKELGYLAMKNEPYGNAGDIECGRIRDIKLDENHYVKLVIYRWAFDAGQDHLSKAEYRLNLCSDDAAREIVDLQSLGTISYDSILADMVAANDANVAAVFWPDDIFANALAPTVKLL